MRTIDSVDALIAWRTAQTGAVGLVPTMGALHAGHLALVERARMENAAVIASIFVNPTQFGEGEDFEAYPRNLSRDLELLEKAGVDAVFTPLPEVMYPAGYQTYVTVEKISQTLEGARRPGHFRGVATVVAKLFNLTRADQAYFGQKDAQQVAVIKRMVYDLSFPVRIIVCPTIRESSGLAMSSRNAYLTTEQRAAAAALYRALNDAGQLYDRGERSPAVVKSVVRKVIESEPMIKLDYVSLADARTLQEVEAPTDDALLLSLAAQVGRPRLLDNCLLPLALNTSAGLSILGAP